MVFHRVPTPPYRDEDVFFVVNPLSPSNRRYVSEFFVQTETRTYHLDWVTGSRVMEGEVLKLFDPSLVKPHPHPFVHTQCP